MPVRESANRRSVPVDSLIFGFGPLVPLIAAAAGAWLLGRPFALLMERLAVIWAAIILVFVAGVRRGYGFADADASTLREIATMLVYFVLGGLALVAANFGRLTAALALLTTGFAMAAVFDRRGALTGDTPMFFARLRGPQMSIAIGALILLLAHHVLASGPST